MGFFSRSKDVQQTSLEALLNQSDDPLKTVRVVISEMEDTLVEARSAAVRALARKKEIERRMADLSRQAKDWEDKASLALEKSREDLARGALGVRLRLLNEAEGLAGLLPPVQAELDKLEADLGELRVKLAEARQRHRLLALQHAGASARKDARSATQSTKSDDALDQLARSVDHLNAEADAFDLGKRKLEAEFAQLQTSSRVDEELQRLRDRIKP